MKYLYFLFFASVYLGVRALEYSGQVPYKWMSFYLTDLCAMPLLLGFLFLAMKVLKKNMKVLPLWFIAGMTVYWSIYFEYYLPLQNSKFTADYLDVIMYCLGSLSFVLWQNRFQKINKQTQQT